MTIRFQCSECGIAIKAPTQRGGAQLPCPKCGKQLTIPRPERTAKAVDEAARFANLVTSMETSSPSSKPAGPATPPAPQADTDPATIQPPGITPPAVTYEPASRVQVKIVDIRLPFASVFRLGLQLWAVGFLIAVAIWMVIAIVAIVLSALGIGLSLAGA